MERRTKRNSIAFAKRKIKRVLAIVMAILLLFTAIDLNGMQYAKAADESKANVITAFAALPEATANQQLAAGALESAINLPNSLSVASGIYNIDTTQTVTGGAISVTGSAISVNPTYNLTGVTWKIEADQSSAAAFDSSVGNTYYTYMPVLPALDREGNTVRLADGVSLPKIRVQIEDGGKWAFSQSKTIDGTLITVKAEKNVFPEGAVLHAEKVTSTADKKKIEDAVQNEIKKEAATKTVEELISFDITITDADGNELQPDTSKGEVKVSFAQLPMVEEASNPSQELKVFHMDASLNSAEGLDTTVDQATGTLEAAAEHFSVYAMTRMTLTSSGAHTLIVENGSEGTDYKWGGKILSEAGGQIDASTALIILSSKPLIISGTTKDGSTYGEVISVPDGIKANLTLKNADMQSKSYSSPITVFPGGELNLTLEGENIFFQDWGSGTGINCPAIRVPQGASLTITKESTGSMTASTQFGSAVIGGRCGIGDYNDFCGNIVINGGILNLTATAGQALGSDSGAAIGSASGCSSCGTITINGGTIHATTGSSAAIGVGWYGFSDMYGNITITGGTVITNTASGYDGIGAYKDVSYSGTLPTVSITGGTVVSKQSLVRPKCGLDPLYRTTVTLDGVGSETAVNEVKVYTEAGAYPYGCQDVMTDASGKLYLWLPENALVASVSTKEGIYTGTILVSPDDKTEGTLTKKDGSYTLKVGAADHADITLSKMEGLKAGEQVLLHINAENGYELAGLLLYEGDTVPAEAPMDISGFQKLGANRYLVVMPEGSRTLYVNMKTITDTGDLVISKVVGCSYVYDRDANTLTLKGSGSITLGMKSGVASTKERIVLGDGAAIALTIDNIVIKEVSGSAIDMLNTAGNCKIIMVGSSEVSSGWNNTVIHKGDGTGTLTFDGEGSLKVSGGSDWAHSGIGASGAENTTGLVFAGGTVTVDVSMSCGAAIGAGYTRDMSSMNPFAKITINGGKVTGYNTKDGQGIGSIYDGGKKGSLTISGGTVWAQGGTNGNTQNGGITDFKSVNVIINGGSVFTQSASTSYDQFFHGQPKNGSGELLYTTVVTVGSGEYLSANALVTGLTIKTSSGVNYPYGITDMYTDGNGKLYLWLPNGAVISAVKTINGTYTGSVTTNNNVDNYQKAEGYFKNSCIPIWGKASGTFNLSGTYFTAVKDITLDTSSLAIGTDFDLAQHMSMLPTNPTNSNVTWSVEDAGTAQASITGDILKINKAGTFTIKATVTNGAAANLDYVKRFSLNVMLTAGLNAGGTAEVIYGEMLSVPITVNAQASGSVVLSKKIDGSEPLASGTIINGHASVVVSADKDFTIGDNSLYLVYTGDSSYSKESREITVKVNQHPLLINIEFAEKFYDGTTDVTIKSVLLSGYISGDLVSLADYTSVKAAAEKADTGIQNIKLSGTFSLSGADAGRYIITQPDHLNLEIKKAARTVPAPAVEGKTDKSVTLSLVMPSAGDKDGQVVYGYATENDSLKVSKWQTETEFTNLDCGTNYYFFAQVGEGTNYKASISTGTKAATEATALQIPTLTNVAGYTYTGSLITAELDQFDSAKMTVSGNTQTDAGTYTLTVQLRDTTKYKWADNTVTAVMLEWKIKKAASRIEIRAEQGENSYTACSDISFVAEVYGVDEPGADGTVTFKTDTEILAVSNSGTMNLSEKRTTFQANWDKEKVKAGDYNITAEYTPASDGKGKNYENVTSEVLSVHVDKANQIALVITEVKGKKYLDKTLSLATTGGSGTGLVTYSVPKDNGVLSISGNTATILGAGKVTVTATKAADSNYNSSTTACEITIGKSAAPSITYPKASKITYGQKLSASTLTEGSNQYGTFAWSNANTVPTVANSGYEVTFTPNANTKANYEEVDITDTVAVTVAKATPTVTVNVALSGNAGSRKATLTAAITGVSDGEVPTGTVKFVNTTSGSDADIAGATAIAISGGKAIYSWTGLADQIYKVKAVYSGSDNYNTATSTEPEVDTRKQNQAAFTIGNIGTKTYGDSSFTLSAIGGSGNGDVTFASSDPTIVSISGATATIHKAGSVTITATKAEDNTYNEATGSITLTIEKKILTVKADNKGNVTKGAVMPKLTYTVTGLAGSDTFTSPIVSATAANTGTTGEYDIIISGGTLTNADSYEVTYVSGRLTIVNPYTPPEYTPSTDTTKTGNSTAGAPFISGDSSKKGWDVIQGQLEQSQKDHTIAIEMNGTTTVPKTVLQSLTGKDTTLVLDLGDGITWSINGQSITSSNLKDVDLGVTLNTDAIPAELLSQIAGKQASTTLSLTYDGPFGFTSVLTMDLNKINAGRYGNLFYYNPETKQLTLQAVEKIGEKGTVELPFPHASDYAVIISEEPMLEKTLNQIAISAVQGTLYVGGTDKKSMTLQLKLPQLLKEAVEKDSSILNITYQSSNPKVAAVDAYGKITAKKAGKATVITLVTINGVQRKFQTEITVRKAYIKLIESANTLKTGSTFTFKAIGYGVNTENIMFYTSKKSVVEINKTTGKAKARNKGTGYIIAKVQNVKAKIKVKVS